MVSTRDFNNALHQLNDSFAAILVRLEAVEKELVQTKKDKATKKA
jgi:hypothetical protein